MIPFRSIIAVCVALCLIRCSSDNLAGATSETTNGVVAMANGTPAAGALVRIVSADFWHDGNMVLDSTRSDSLGRFTVPHREWGKTVNFQIDHVEGALFVRSFVAVGSETFTLQNHGAYSGEIKNSTYGASNVRLVGTTYRVPVDSTGVYNFGPIAPGTYPILFEIGEGLSTTYALNTSVNLKAGDTLVDSMAVADPAVVPLDRFDASFGLTTLGYLVDQICWYYYTDSLSCFYDPVTDNWLFYSSIPQIQRGNSIMEVLSIPDGYLGGKIHATVVLGNKTQYSYAGLGVILAANNSNVPMNLSSMTALRLTASGRGTVRIRLESPILDAVGGNRHYTFELTLPQSEQTIWIPVDSLFLSPSDTAIQTTHPWSSVSTSIERIEFEFSFLNNAIGDTLSFTCDDIIFEGARLEDIFAGSQ